MADWHVWRADEPRDEARTIRGCDSEEEAAEKWAEEDDWSSGDYNIIAQLDEPEVLVAPADGSLEPVRLNVSGEAVPTYTARRTARRTAT
jgi:hypothetical protein